MIMDFEIREKIINIVRNYKCLYDPRDRNYKNSSYKTMLWGKIGGELGIEGEAAKKIWRSLRDGYKRFKKQSKPQTGSGRKTTHYIWSEQLAFLDGSMQLRPTGMNIMPTRENSDSHSYPGTSTDSSASVMLSTPASTQLSAYETIESLSPSHQEISAPQEQELVPPQDIGSPTVSPQPSPPQSLPPQPATRRPNVTALRRTIDSTSNLAERQDKILEYIKNKKPKKTLDGIDHMFMSYASTFKTFTPLKQAELKLELAKLFAEAEIERIQNHQPDVPVLVISSPAYSVMSQDDIHTGTMIEVPEDLSLPNQQEDTSTDQD